MRSSLQARAAPPPPHRWLGPVRAGPVVRRDMMGVVARCRRAIPELRRDVRAARCALESGHPDRDVRAELRDRLRELELDLEAARAGEIEAMRWAEELASSGASFRHSG